MDFSLKNCFQINIAVIFTFFSLFIASNPSHAQERGASGYPLPRFVSIAHNVANMRTGPSTDYPIKWVYHRKYYPLEVIDEYGPWRKVRDLDGTVGWMHTQVLSGRRTVLITKDGHSLTKEPILGSEKAIIADKGVIGRILSCATSWCRLEIDNVKAWAKTSTLYGVYPNEVID
ncbi:SH3 domain-containing protein [Temperatibacter marinus]|uniref:SH3 domain-containing protein n=1 Tax=Temperatibacter marinus TaxID=1456591 RepID=A0AA52EF34_9PROT|nr:SH3 domain-containing protein [Temperatibacter marinus]WND01362.1 SH3 domain-containing protein [Temperatibacter marinus]